VSHVHRRSPDPRADRCSCGESIAPRLLALDPAPAPADKAGNYQEYVDRDIWLERHLTEMAARSAGFLKVGPDGKVAGDAGGLDEFADGRAWSGGVRASIDAVRECQEELADARHYCVWGIQQVWDAHVAGDSAASETYSRLMRALEGVVGAWHALAGSTRVSG
jgi:hypothetical protein